MACALPDRFFSDSERAVLLMKVQLALGSRWVLKKDTANALPKYGLDFDEVIKNLGSQYTILLGNRLSYRLREK